MTEKEKARRAFMFEIIRNTQDKVSWLVFAEWLSLAEAKARMGRMQALAVIARKEDDVED